MFATLLDQRDIAVSSEEEIELGKKLIVEMRTSFSRSDWDGTTRSYERLAGLKADRGLRLEATCLAVRTLVVIQQRSAARQLLATVATGDYTKAPHYEFLARAYLDLKQYKDAAAACERAEELRLAEQK